MVKYICEVENRKLYPWIECPIIVDTSFGSSWGGCIDFEVEYTERGISLKGEGLRNDFNTVFNACDSVYGWTYEVSKIEEIEKQPKDKVIKDKFNWEVGIIL